MFSYWKNLDSEDSPRFIRCIIDTMYGELEIIHSMASVKEEQRKNLHKGSIVSAVIYLSGDVAIYDYEHGIVKDEEHNLKALRYSITGGDVSRINTILADNVVYSSEVIQRTFKGKENVINRLDYVNNNCEEKYYSYMATITAVDDGEYKLDYCVGKRCIALACGEMDNFESILFIDCNDDGDITRILVSNDRRYCFNTP